MKDSTKIKIDTWADYIPVFSTVTNATDLTQRFRIWKGDLKDDNEYTHYLKSKNITRQAVGIIPVAGNVLLASYDLSKFLISLITSSPKQPSESKKPIHAKPISNAPPSFDTLPREIEKEIFRHLTTPEVGRLARVSIDVQAASENEIIDRINSNRPLPELGMKTGQDILSFIKSLSEEKRAEIRHLNFEGVDICRKDALSILKLLPPNNLESIDLYRTKYPSPEFTDIVPFSRFANLKTLKIKVGAIYTASFGVSRFKDLPKLETLFLGNLTYPPPLYFLYDLPELKHLHLEGIRSSIDLAPISHLSKLTHLEIVKGSSALNFSSIFKINSLVHLELDVRHEFTVFDPFTQLTNLKHLKLKIWGNKTVYDLGALSNLKKLEWLSIDAPWLRNFSFLASLTQLRHLDLSKCFDIQSLEPLKQLYQLKTLKLYLTQTPDLNPLEPLTQLQTLSLAGSSISDISVIGALTHLRELKLYQSENITNLTPIQHLRQLQYLYINRCENIQTIPPLSELIQLREFKVKYSLKLSDISCLSDISGLKHATITQCPLVSNFSALSSHTGLQSLFARDCPAIKDLTFLSGLTALEKLNLSGCIGIQDLSPLRSLLKLHTLSLGGCKEISSLEALRNLQALRALNLSSRKLDGYAATEVFGEAHMHEFYLNPNLDYTPIEALQNLRLLVVKDYTSYLGAGITWLKPPPYPPRRIFDEIRLPKNCSKHYGRDPDLNEQSAFRF